MFFFQTYSASIDSIIDFRYCQELFYFFEFFILFKRFKKIRRRRDLNPRTARTVYTLSRGASSATWVLLQIHCIQFWIAFISDAFEIILYEFTFVNAFFHFFQLFILYLTWLTETLFFLSPVFLLILKKTRKTSVASGPFLFCIFYKAVINVVICFFFFPVIQNF